MTYNQYIESSKWTPQRGNKSLNHDL